MYCRAGNYRSENQSVWEISELVFSDVPPAENAHHILPLQPRYLVADDGGRRGGTRRLHHQSGPVEGGDRSLDLLVADEDDALHVPAAQVEGKCAWDVKRGRKTQSTAGASMWWRWIDR